MTKIRIEYSSAEVEHILKEHIQEQHKITLIKRGAFSTTDLYSTKFNWGGVDIVGLTVLIDSDKTAKADYNPTFTIDNEETRNGEEEH